MKTSADSIQKSLWEVSRLNASTEDGVISCGEHWERLSVPAVAQGDVWTVYSAEAWFSRRAVRQRCLGAAAWSATNQSCHFADNSCALLCTHMPAAGEVKHFVATSTFLLSRTLACKI